MGQPLTKRESKTSAHPLTTVSPTPSTTSITQPAPPTRSINRLSELLNPDEFRALKEDEIIDDGSPRIGIRPMVTSPSGQRLSAAQYFERSDRILTMEERKKAIVERTKEKIEKELGGAEGGGNGGEREEEKGWKGWRGWKGWKEWKEGLCCFGEE